MRKNKIDDRIYTDPGLPFAQCRHSRDSGRHYKPHMHKAFCIGALEQGEVVYQIGERTTSLQPGSLALINPEVPHACNPAENQTRHYFMLFLDPDWCLQIQQSLWQTDTFCPAAIDRLDDQTLYRQYMEAMAVFMGNCDLLEKEQVLVRLLETIFLRACEPAASNPGPAPAHIDQLRQLLEKDLGEDTTMARLAAALNANPYTLLRQFKAATGLTPHAFRLNCRIERAKTLLEKGEDLAQVALTCGFFDQSHLHRHFKAVTTMTPKAYQVNFIQ